MKLRRAIPAALAIVLAFATSHLHSAVFDFTRTVTGNVYEETGAHVGDFSLLFAFNTNPNNLKVTPIIPDLWVNYEPWPAFRNKYFLNISVELFANNTISAAGSYSALNLPITLLSVIHSESGFLTPDQLVIEAPFIEIDFRSERPALASTSLVDILAGSYDAIFAQPNGWISFAGQIVGAPTRSLFGSVSAVGPMAANLVSAPGTLALIGVGLSGLLCALRWRGN